MTKWVDSSMTRMIDKISAENKRLAGKTPYIPYDGHYGDVMLERGADWWTNGFWGGILWQLYQFSNRSEFREAAIIQEKRLDQALYTFKDIHHDVGFMWLLTAVAHFKITGDEQSYHTGIHAANILAGRFNIDGNFLVAWNDHPGWVIIDSMMNIQLLYWASEETQDPRFAKIATKHADTVAKYLVRPDGSVGHIASFDAQTGHFIEQLAGQGVDANSAWSRGNAWAIYGFALTYKHTKNPYYLEIAEKVAHFFVAQCDLSGMVPLADFRAPESPKLHDTSAGMIAACGLLEIETCLPRGLGDKYRKVAKEIMHAIEVKYADWNLEEDGIISGGTEAYHRPATYEVPLIYTDYFFLEGLLKLRNQAIPIW